MTNIIRRFLWAWRYTAESLTYSADADAEFGWMPEDATNWRHFISKTPTGAKMRAKLTNLVMRVAISATKKHDDRDFWCGFARGCAITIANLERLGEVVPVKEETNDQTK